MPRKKKTEKEENSTQQQDNFNIDKVLDETEDAMFGSEHFVPTYKEALKTIMESKHEFSFPRGSWNRVGEVFDLYMLELNAALSQQFTRVRKKITGK